MDFQISGKYSFEVYPVAVLGTAFKNVEVLAIIDKDTANALGLDTRAMHAAVYPTLPPSTPNDPGKYNYLKIRTPSGETQILGLAWINMNTVEVVNLGRFTLTLENRAASDQARIINALSANGMSVSKVVFEQVS